MSQLLNTARARLSQAEAWLREPTSARDRELNHALRSASIEACWALWGAIELAGLEEDGAVSCILQGGQVTLYLRTGGTVAPIPREQIPAWIQAWLGGDSGQPGSVLAATERLGWIVSRQEDPVSLLEEDLSSHPALVGERGLGAICSWSASRGRPLWGELADQLWGRQADRLPLEGRIYAALLAPYWMDDEIPPGQAGRLLTRTAKACSWRSR